MRGRTLLRYFGESDLQPTGSQPIKPRELIPALSSDELKDIREFAEKFGRDGAVHISASDLMGHTHVAMFLRICVTLGAISAKPVGPMVHIQPAGRLGRHVPEILHAYLENDYVVFPDWERRRGSSEDELSAVEFIQHLELRRIAQERRSGLVARHLAERPVAFAVFRGTDSSGQSCYLFEINKDWGRLNFVGGKQEPDDGGDYRRTVLREIEEELGIGPGRVTVTVTVTGLNDEPIIGFSLSGNVGSLARYPCVLFSATVEGPLDTKPYHHWLSERTIREIARCPDSPLMVNPRYLDFLLDGTPSRLSTLPVSTPGWIRSTSLKALVPKGEPRRSRWTRVMRENKDLAAAVITLAAAVITLALAV